MLEVDAANRDPATNRAPVAVRLIPLIEDLSLEATDGTLLRRSRPALFRGLGRRPRGGDRWGRLGRLRHPRSLRRRPVHAVPAAPVPGRRLLGPDRARVHASPPPTLTSPTSSTRTRPRPTCASPSSTPTTRSSPTTPPACSARSTPARRRSRSRPAASPTQSRSGCSRAACSAPAAPGRCAPTASSASSPGAVPPAPPPPPGVAAGSPPVDFDAAGADPRPAAARAGPEPAAPAAATGAGRPLRRRSVTGLAIGAVPAIVPPAATADRAAAAARRRSGPHLPGRGKARRGGGDRGVAGLLAGYEARARACDRAALPARLGPDPALAGASVRGGPGARRRNRPAPAITAPHRTQRSRR